MKPYSRSVFVSSFANFKVRIYVIGYRNIGESIVVFMIDDNKGVDKVVFSMIIDCYKKGDLNIAMDLLKKHGVSELDFAIWTHPHDDHSPGFDEIISSFASSKTKVFLPRFEFENFDPGVLTKKCKRANLVSKALLAIEKNKFGKNGLLHPIYTDPDYPFAPQIIFVDEHSDPPISKLCTFYFLTPVTKLIEPYTFIGNPEKIHEVNELSISFVMSLDGYEFYFGGDSENEHVKKIKKEDVANMRWVKVPHHCSDGAFYIADALDKDRFDFAVSTVYGSKLPMKPIQDIYKNKGMLFMTQLRGASKLIDYGVVQFDYHQFDQSKIKVETTLYGNADQYK